MIETLKVIWCIFKVARRIYVTYFDDDPTSSKARSNVLKQAMEAANVGDVLLLNATIEYFDRVSKYNTNKQ